MVPSGPLTILFGMMIVVYLFTLGFFHLMIFKVNRGLPYEDRIPHSLYWRRGGWSELKARYQGFYPRSHLYSVTLYLTVLFFCAAVALTAILWWRFMHGK
jgi:hypothetical protein